MQQEQNSQNKQYVLPPRLLWSLRILFPLLILSGAVELFKYMERTKPEVPTNAPEEQVWSIQTAQVKISDHRPELLLYGEAKPGRRVELRSLVAGEIIQTSDKLVDGAIVKKGEVLLKVDPFRYEGALTEAKARLDEAKARLTEIEANIKLETSALKLLTEQLEIAERDLKRAIELSRKGTVSQKLKDDRRVIVSQRRQSLEQRQATLQVQKSKHIQQKAIITRLEWGVKQAERDLGDTVLVSPFEAYVDAVNAEVGRIVSANDRVATLLDKNRIDVQFTLSDSQYGRIISSGEPLIGRDVMIDWRVSNPPLRYKAKIARVNSQISADTGGVEVFARIINPLQGSPVRAGAFLEVRVPDRNFKNVAKLPQTALFENKYVYVVNEGRLSKRKVRQIGTIGKEILVTGELKQDDLVLTTRLSTVGEGLRVKVRDNVSDAEKTTGADLAKKQSAKKQETASK